MHTLAEQVTKPVFDMIKCAYSVHDALSSENKKDRNALACKELQPTASGGGGGSRIGSGTHNKDEQNDDKSHTSASVRHLFTSSYNSAKNKRNDKSATHPQQSITPDSHKKCVQGVHQNCDQLAKIVSAWPLLPKHIRKTILTLIDSCLNEGQAAEDRLE